MKYRKKPVVIEAIQWSGLNLEEVKSFVGKDLQYDICDTVWEVGKGVPHILMKIKTLEGDHFVTKGDYIIKGIKGEFYPCKPDIFKQTYEVAKDDESIIRAKEKGETITLPYKVGTKVYVVASQTSNNRNLYIFEDTISHYVVGDYGTMMCFEHHVASPDWNWNKVFPSRGEAEEMLKDGE